jgi:hemolysin activation/secretion protein
MLEAPPNAEKLFFVLHSVVFSGATVYPEQKLQAFFAPYIGKRISLLQVYQVAQAITQKYRNDGYLLAQVVVPPQVIDTGIVHLRIVEGFVNKVEIMPARVGQKPLNSTILDKMGQKLTQTRPVSNAELERTLMLMNMLPGVTARAVLKSADNAPGGTDAVILTSRQRVSGYVQADNRGSRYLGPGQLAGGVTLNGVTDADDALSLQGTTTTQRSELHALAANYRRMLTPDGLTLNVAASQQGTHPGYLLEPFDVKGKDKSVSLGLSYPLLLSRQRTDTLYGNIINRDVDSSTLGTVLSKDHIRALQLGYTSLWQDAALGSDWSGANLVNVEFKQGLDAFGASGPSSATSRPGANPAFSKLNVSLSREQSLKRSKWSVYGEVSGQYATTKLLTPEQFGLGGERLGSAYDSSEIIGDSGYGVRGELRYLIIPQHNILSVNSVQPYAFYDYGQAFIRDVPAGQKPHPSLASTGVGARMDIGKGYSLSFEAAKPLTREVAALNSKGMRLFVNVRKTF